MKRFLIALILLFSMSAQARTVAFVCRWHGWVMVMAPDIDDKAVEVRRVFEHEGAVIYIRLPISSGETWADVQVQENGKTTRDRALCEMGE